MDRIDRIIGVAIPLVMLVGVVGVVVSGVMMLTAPREVVSDIQQCSSTARVVRVSVGDAARHELQMWGCMDDGCAYWTTATYDRREEAMVYCHGGEEIKI